MKVIGTTGDYGKEYICVVTHDELGRLTDKHYGKLDRLKVGDEMDLGEGYNFAQRIEEACRKMTEATTSFGSAQGTLTRFARMISEQGEKSE